MPDKLILALIKWILFSFILCCPCFCREVTAVFCPSSEIGQATVDSLHRQGKQTLLIGRAKADIQVDFANSSGLDSLRHYLKDTTDVVKGIVIITPRPAFGTEALPLEGGWEEMFSLCYIRPLEAMKQLLPFMEGGNIVIISGATSKAAIPAFASFGVLRLMWLAEAKSLAAHLGPRGILVNTISPGPLAVFRHRERRKEEANKTATGRLTTPHQVAEAVLFFLDQKANITGQNIVIDGGACTAY